MVCVSCGQIQIISLAPKTKKRKEANVTQYARKEGKEWALSSIAREPRAFISLFSSLFLALEPLLFLFSINCQLECIHHTLPPALVVCELNFTFFSFSIFSLFCRIEKQTHPYCLSMHVCICVYSDALTPRVINNRKREREGHCWHFPPLETQFVNKIFPPLQSKVNKACSLFRNNFL